MLSLLLRLNYVEICASFAVALIVTAFLAHSARSKRCYHLQKQAKKKVQERDSKIHSCLSLPDGMDGVVLEDGGAVQEKYAEGSLSCEAVMLECIKQTHAIGRKHLNAVTEEFYDAAVEEAQSLDTQRTRRGTLRLSPDLPLLGLPVSIKDCIYQKDADATCGIAARCFRPAAEDGLIVRLVRAAGGIPFVRTNVPQLLMMPDSENSVWGRTVNPWDASRTCGGSSGGEGALVAAGCSVVGIGGDIGGSIRIPAHFCGVVGFKPTPMRMTRAGHAVPRLENRHGQTVIVPSVGPLTRRVSDIRTPPLPWNSAVTVKGTGKKRLRIAYMKTDGWFDPVPAVQRAVDVAVDALREQGHEVIPFENPIDTEKLLTTYIALMSADGNWYSFLRGLEGEQLYSSYRDLYIYTEIPNWARPVICSLLRSLGEHRKAAMFECTKSGGLSVRDYWEYIADKKEIEDAYMKAFADQNIDALVLPALGIVAPPHNMAAQLLPALSYTFLANLLHWPAGTLPVTEVKQGEDTYEMSSLPQRQRDSVAKLTEKTMRGSVGLPVGVQVMTPMWRDEECLYVMGLIEQAVDRPLRLPPGCDRRNML